MREKDKAHIEHTSSSRVVKGTPKYKDSFEVRVPFTVFDEESQDLLYYWSLEGKGGHIEIDPSHLEVRATYTIRH